MTPRWFRDVLTGRSRPRLAARIALAALVQDTAVPSERRCAGCGEPIPTAPLRQRYCSLACKQHAYRARRQPPGTATP